VSLLRSLLCLALILPGLLRAAETQTPRSRPIDPKRIESLIRQLGREKYAERERAMRSLVRIGEPARPALESARKHTDPEIAWRAARAAKMIRWQIAPEIDDELGGIMSGFSQMSFRRKERTIRDVGLLGGDAAVPILREIIQAESNFTLKRAAVRALALVGPAGFSVLLAGNLPGIDVFDADLFLRLGNAFLEKKQYARAITYYKKVLEIDEGETTALYNIACAYARMRKTAESITWLEKAIGRGFRDLSLMLQDADLNSLRKDPRFKKLIEKLQQEANRPVLPEFEEE